ncbi:TPA: hypothetical protein RFW42_005478 [Klebsiella pneumoniae subsp. pneumoniae]|nr:hypothetical protein [Klebsiella pneumoniae subsp. pneumoniae]HDU3724759.1 hypothetical protein [Klebsiella pneumoniae subsp. pneumoniae]HDU3740710.1 hypothetical protein [Klebsiella pneumoniae subsp. pneumoniae]HDU5905069.1 hypothetical protein [Klebsiella pneumoniae subsp. pneumoniae]
MKEIMKLFDNPASLLIVGASLFSLFFFGWKQGLFTLWFITTVIFIQECILSKLIRMMK